MIAEDTRVTKVLLAHYGIATPLVAYHEHNAAVMRPHLLARLANGAALALVSDAGTPLISDPGYKLVARLWPQGLPVTSVPGASAVLTALVVAGLPTDRFFFEGFLPPKSAARRAANRELAAIPGTLVFFESPQPRRRMLEGPRRSARAPRGGAGARTHQNFRDGAARHAAGTRRRLRRGTAAKGRNRPSRWRRPPKARSRSMPKSSTGGSARRSRALSVKEAAIVVAIETGQPRRKVYARAVELSARDR